MLTCAYDICHTWAMKKQKINEQDRELLLQYGLQGVDFTQAARVVFEQGEFISHAGEPIDCIYFVVSGKAKVFLSLSSGKQLLLAYFTSKGIIGDIELMTNKPSNYTTVQAVTEFSCVALPLDIYGVVLKSNIVFINHIAAELAEKLIQRAINGTITTLQPLEARLCAYISQGAIGDFFCETLTEVAMVVGASYRHLLRCLDRLCAEGVLRKEARLSSVFRITDKEALEKKAGDLYMLK